MLARQCDLAREAETINGELATGNLEAQHRAAKENTKLREQTAALTAENERLLRLLQHVSESQWSCVYDVRKFVKDTLKEATDDLLKNQEPLGGEFQAVLNEVPYEEEEMRQFCEWIDNYQLNTLEMIILIVVMGIVIIWPYERWKG